MVHTLLDKGVSFGTVYRAGAPHHLICATLTNRPCFFLSVAFVTLGLLLMANFLMRTRVPPRPLRAVSDLEAFKELPYLFFTLGKLTTHFSF